MQRGQKEGRNKKSAPATGSRFFERTKLVSMENTNSPQLLLRGVDRIIMVGDSFQMVLFSYDLPELFFYKLGFRHSQAYSHYAGCASDIDTARDGHAVHHFRDCHIKESCSSLQTVIDRIIHHRACAGQLTHD